MFTGAFFGLIAWLYYLATLLLVALTLFIATQGSRRTRPRLCRTFLLLSLSLLLWQLTLFVEARTALPVTQLWPGRFNFAAIALVPYLAWRFVQEVSATGSRQVSKRTAWCRMETALLTALTLLTPLVDAAERVAEGQAITTYGPLFPLYLVHVLGYLAAALILAFRERHRTRDRMVRGQLMLIGGGMLATGAVAFITNALVPYSFGDFRWCDLGTLSTVGFVGAVAYSTLVQRLFALRVVLRATLVNGLLLTFVLGAYSSAVCLVTLTLTGSEGTNSASKVTQFAVLLIAFSVDPLRRYLEKKTDRLLFGDRGTRM